MTPIGVQSITGRCACGRCGRRLSRKRETQRTRPGHIVHSHLRFVDGDAHGREPHVLSRAMR